MKTLGIAAPASPFDKALFERGVKQIKQWGFDVFFQPDIFSEERYLAGSILRRKKELEALFSKDAVNAILFARGGYGTQQILPYLDFKQIQKHPKPVIGCSDLTPLLNLFSSRYDIPAFYGPVVTQIGKGVSPRTLESLRNILTSNNPLSPIHLKECIILKEGRCTAKLIGGCLSLMTTSLATPYALSPKSSLLFLEDVDEKVYAADRMITQLKHSGFLKECRGILIGSLKAPPEDPHSMQEMLRERLGDFEGPVVTEFPAGHTQDFLTLPLGRTATLDTQKKELSF